MPTVPDLLEIDFVAQFRFPTLASYASRRISIAASELERRQAIAWAAEQIGRTVGSFVQADRHADRGGAPIPADARALRWSPRPDPFLTELELPWVGAAGLIRLAEETDIDDDPDLLLGRLRHLGRALQWLASYRLVVLTGHREKLSQGWVFMGPEQALPLWLRGASVRDLPTAVPLLIDPRDGRFLTLDPYVRFVADPRRLDLFVGLEGNEARYMAYDGSNAYLAPVPNDTTPQRGRVELTEADARMLVDPTCVLDDGVEFDGRYRIIGWVARGGVAEIYLARRLQTGRLCAIKLFVSEDNRFDRNLTRFIEEGRFRERIESDAVVRVGHKGVVGNHRYMDMEYLPGGDLAEWMARSGPLPPTRALAVIHRIIDALQSIHAAGIVHRDIKPANVMFTWEGGPRLIDLGIARDLPVDDSKAGSTGRLGTEGYMAPEQSRGRRVDERTDVYGVGVLMHEMITGLRPDQATGRERCPDVPRGLESIIARCLAFKPDGRYPDMPSLRRALRQWAQRRPDWQDPAAISLDLEGTLITNALDAQPRPGLGEFMDWCHERFQRIYVYTCVDEQRSRDILAGLVYEGRLGADVADRMEYVPWSRGFDGARKDLRRCAFPVERNVIVDDMALWIVPDQRHRWVQAPDYNEADPTDRFLTIARRRIERLL